MYAFCVCGMVGKKTVSKLFVLFIIAFLLPFLDMCGYLFYSGQKNPFRDWS